MERFTLREEDMVCIWKEMFATVSLAAIEKGLEDEIAPFKTVVTIITFPDGIGDILVAVPPVGIDVPLDDIKGHIKATLLDSLLSEEAQATIVWLEDDTFKHETFGYVPEEVAAFVIPDFLPDGW